MAKVLIGHIEDIDKKGARTFRYQDLEIAVFRLSDGEIKAVENRCPHKGGKLAEGMVCGTAVHCPLHDWKIDLKSGKVYEPDDGCVETYKTEVDQANGAIYITI
ncbi:nitrite reductase small subunit NirD [Cohnella thailandensis]|jgi:nitrite reductase [NAD(P)H], small subunit|uniref:Nitrite reductase small subunit NirD n=1 Tax=Cohnella thailandensis TaxID=557557 RepID=A0A841SLZ9_9BACL|nr:nitrite reductase small subunit NirD [Cohnella thailandensis]MBB6632944.1 nitrite reductase small subunit NirD [Cohnella thailandensis]MBP1975363.1 nitrite reductase (NADH) small subunit [Cohnella thailandensis]